jgi:hypothetical protein
MRFCSHVMREERVVTSGPSLDQLSRVESEFPIWHRDEHTRNQQVNENCAESLTLSCEISRLWLNISKQNESNNQPGVDMIPSESTRDCRSQPVNKQIRSHSLLGWVNSNLVTQLDDTSEPKIFLKHIVSDFRISPSLHLSLFLNGSINVSSQNSL